jgi:hypothetical protein
VEREKERDREMRNNNFHNTSGKIIFQTKQHQTMKTWAGRLEEVRNKFYEILLRVFE